MERKGCGMCVQQDNRNYIIFPWEFLPLPFLIFRVLFHGCVAFSFLSLLQC
jgi:hypothetical protein